MTPLQFENWPEVDASQYYLLMLLKYQFKLKNSEIKYYALCSGNTSKDFTMVSGQLPPTENCPQLGLVLGLETTRQLP